MPSKKFTADEVAALNTLNSNGLSLPQQDIQGIDLATTLRLGQETKQIHLKIGLKKTNETKGSHQKSVQQPDTQGSGAVLTDDGQSSDKGSSEADAAGSDGTQWAKIQKSFGPVHLERVGLKFKEGKIQGLLDADLSAAALTIALDGLSVSSPLSPLRPAFALQGLGIDYRNGPVEIGGSFLKQELEIEGQKHPSFAGLAVIRTEEFTLSAFGSYTTLRDHPSMFIYAVLDEPLGGPAFFFVTGLAVGFGFNRALKVPTVDQVATFPLVAEAMKDDSKEPAPDDHQGRQNTLTTTLAKMECSIPPAIGETFFAVGVRFTSFKMIDSFALITVSFGQRCEIDVLGLSTLIVPTPEAGKSVSPLAEAQLALKATFLPDEGFLGVKAQLTPSSYILSRDCHLTGGFAFYSWFGGPHAGDFVTTLGGYHPGFQVPAHYPSVPRLGFNWRVDDHISIKGDAYFALTAHALMAGGHLEATWQSGSLAAWFVAGADFQIAWKPYHYDARIYVDIGASYTYHLFGTHHITADVGADLHIWGPDFAGNAHIHLSIVSFDVAFGVASAQLAEPIDWESFKTSFLPADEAVCGVSVKNGLVRTVKDGKEGTDSERWIINPKHFSLATNSVIPFKKAYKKRAPNGNKIDIGKAKTNIAVGPMAVVEKDLVTEQTITITRDGNNAEDDFAFTPILKDVPAGLWGAPKVTEAYGKKFLELPDMNGHRMIKNTLAGFEVRPANPPKAGTTQNIDCRALRYETETIPDAYGWQEFKLADSQGKAAWTEAARTEAKDSLVRNTKRDELLKALGLASAEINFGQPVDEDVLVMS